MGEVYGATKGAQARARYATEHPEHFLAGREHLSGQRVIVWRVLANGAFHDRDAPNTGLIRELDRTNGPQAWTAPWAMGEGDLLLVHRAGAHGQEARDLLEVSSHPHTDRTAGDWSDKVVERFVFVRLVTRLRKGIHWEDWTSHPGLRQTAHARTPLRGQEPITDVWPLLHGLLLDRNRRLAKHLRPWEPQ